MAFLDPQSLKDIIILRLSETEIGKRSDDIFRVSKSKKISNFLVFLTRDTPKRTAFSDILGGSNIFRTPKSVAFYAETRCGWKLFKGSQLILSLINGHLVKYRT